jgi:predicted peptidase
MLCTNGPGGHPARARRVLFATICAGLATTGCSRPTTGFLTRSLTRPDGQVARYSIFLPHGYSADKDKAVPVILFLHGAGEAGTDGETPTRVGIGPAIRAREATFPFLVIFPQARDRVPATHGSWLPGQPDAECALAILDAVQREYRTDARRVYLTGVSVGANGVWHLAAADPKRWAAIVPICGLGPLTKAVALRDVPCWCFHGAEDGNIPVEHSRNMIEALRGAGGRPRYTEYSGVGHDSWEKAYANNELFDWLMQQKLPD